MDIDSFFVIGTTEDGDTIFDGPITRAELSRRLESEEHYGAIRKFAKKNPGTDGSCVNLKNDELLIIKGTIVQPNVVQVATKYEFK